jgi:uncharacterized MnhB-related membrane protein
MIDILHGMVLIMLLATAFFAMWFKTLLPSAISLSMFSLMMALEFYILQAPDVAIAEASIGAALSTTIYIFAIRACSKPRRTDGREKR